jgi:hypothetical protein
MVDELTPETERRHEGDLAAVDVSAVEVVHLFGRELFAFVEADEFCFHAVRLRMDSQAPVMA